MDDVNVYTQDETDADVLLSSVGQQVMMAWERDYMEQCVVRLAITPASDVLEIGFGLGYSATKIMTYSPKTYTIIECDPVVIARIEAWAQGYSNVRIVQGTWQTQLPVLPAYDCIFFDDYPLPQNERDDANHTISRWYEFLDLALNWHTKLDGRITGYLARPLNLDRPGCTVSLQAMQVNVPAHCSYFPYKEALVPLITRCEEALPQVTAYGLPTRGGVGPVAVAHPKLIALRRQLDAQKHIEATSFSAQPEAATSPTHRSRADTLRALREAKARKDAASTAFAANSG